MNSVVEVLRSLHVLLFTVFSCTAAEIISEWDVYLDTHFFFKRYWGGWEKTNVKLSFQRRKQWLFALDTTA